MIEFIKLIEKFRQVACLLIIDLLAFYTCTTIAWAFRSEVAISFVPDIPVFIFSYTHFILLWWIPIIYIFFLFYEKLYDNNLPFWDETRNIVKAITLATLTVMAIITLGKMSDRVSRLVLLAIWTSSIFIFPIFRLWGKKILYRAGIWRERVLILGAGNSGRLVMDGIGREKHMGYDVVGFLDDDDAKKGTFINNRKVFGKIKYFPRYLNRLRIKTVIIAIPSLTSEKLSELTSSVQSYATNTMVIPDIKGIALLNTDLLHLFYEEIFLMSIKNNLKSLINRIIKRLFDISVSIVSMPLVLPVIGFLGLIIKLESPGPAIYAHDRIGKNGRIFRCYKFRTMQKDAEEKLKEILENNEQFRLEWEKNWKIREDPRTTKTGRFLRKTSLDELPQIFNVIWGDMSLAGPRPYLPREKDDIGKNFQIICSAKPGITGLWQVSGRSNTDYEYRVKLDSWYVMNWSLWLDIAILFKTVRVVFKMDGAY